MPQERGFHGGSFRDRDGRVFLHQDRVYRVLSRKARDDFEALSKTEFYGRFQADGRIIGTTWGPEELLDAPELAGEWAGVLLHQKVPYVSYPYEWSFGMLRDAGLLEIELLLAALAEDMDLKDGTPYNVQFLGASPVFIDVLSFERRSRETAWFGYRQFCETILFPLFLQAYKDVDFHPWLRGSLEGLPAEQFTRLLTFRDLFKRGVFSHAYLHAKLQTRYNESGRAVGQQLSEAGFNRDLVRRNAEGLAALLRQLQWRRTRSEWSEYGSEHGYAQEDQRAKEDFVRRAVSGKRRRLVWDLGANTGRYSLVAKDHADYVVAFDSDHLAIDRLYERLRSQNVADVLPLVVDLANPSPALGWRNRERQTIDERGRPDFALCLALVHHLAIGGNIPLSELEEWLAQTSANLVVEFVTKEDPMVKRLLANRADIFADYDPTTFEQILGRHFRVADRMDLGSGTRTLYFATQE